MRIVAVLKRLLGFDSPNKEEPTNDGAPLDVRTALAGMYFATNGQDLQDNRKLPEHKRKPKDAPRTDIDELWDAFYMVATYCFTLQRKMEYICKFTREFVGDERLDDPKIRAAAMEILEDKRELDAQGPDWRARAETAEEIIIRLYKEIGEEHADLLRRAAGGPGAK